MLLLNLILITIVAHTTHSARILSILPVAIKSHSILFDRLMRELANTGHNVTFITPIEVKEPPKNLNVITLPDLRDVLAGANSCKSMIRWRNIPSWLLMTGVPYFGLKISEYTLEQPIFKELIEGEPFDLIFGEPFMDESIVAGFSHKHKAPIVMISTLMPNFWSNYVSGNAAPASYIPDPLLAYPSQMTFCQRVCNLLFGIYMELLQRVNLFFHDRLMRHHFGDDMPYIDDIIRNTSLLLVNDHYSISFPRPQLPNTVEVAGMHVFPPKKLPKELDDFIGNSKNGVILFSLGTNTNSSDLPKETVDGVLRALGRLKENVLWKFEAELENLPKNVKIAKWLPQSDILAHPNLKLFITHGGMLSTTEAVVRGVPVVGIPIAADQPSNMKHNENAGLGKTIQLDDLSEETLYETVTEVLTNPKYREAAKLRSKLLHDTMMPPLESAVWWIEYVLRHNGAPHLRSAAQDLYWFQLHQIDTMATLIVGLLSILAFDLWILSKIFKRICKGKCKDATGEKKKQ